MESMILMRGGDSSCQAYSNCLPGRLLINVLFLCMVYYSLQSAITCSGAGRMNVANLKHRGSV